MKTHSDELTLFVAVVEAGSFRQAAENLGMDNSVVSRGIKRLEEKLSTVLLNRTTRRV
ncbi:MAG: helix-turn-helix domain-containing protein, partial [Aeromonas veronii]